MQKAKDAGVKHPKGWVFSPPATKEGFDTGKTSRDKGARGEREVVALLRAEGYDARRGFQLHRKGGENNPDVMALPGIHIEVKRTESFRLWDALAQAKADCGDRIPTVWHRKNNCPWVVVMDAHDFMTIYRAWESEFYRED